MNLDQFSVGHGPHNLSDVLNAFRIHAVERRSLTVMLRLDDLLRLISTTGRAAMVSSAVPESAPDHRGTTRAGAEAS